MKIRFLSAVYAVLAWVLGAISVLHMATTFSLHAATPFTRVWFFGTGIAMAEMAALNLLHRLYGRTMPALRWITRAFNTIMLGFAAVAGRVTSASTPELMIMLSLLSALLFLSFASAAGRSDNESVSEESVR
jgi:peptidoglycan/LPS O-acetylase OafA/YrhL